MSQDSVARGGSLSATVVAICRVKAKGTTQNQYVPLPEKQGPPPPPPRRAPHLMHHVHVAGRHKSTKIPANSAP